MVNISKKELGKKALKKIRAQFFKLFSSWQGKKHTGILFEELLSDSEIIMLSKRLAIIVMLHNGYTTYEIHHSLKVSTDTIKKTKQKMRKNEFPTIERAFGRRKSREVGDLMETILYAGMPPFEYKGRRKWMKKMRGEINI